MVKHAQTIRWQIADELFECHFVGVALKGLRLQRLYFLTKSLKKFCSWFPGIIQKINQKIQAEANT